MKAPEASEDVGGEILDRLSSENDGRIFNLRWLSVKRVFEIEEACDMYFTARLTGDDLRKLGRELIAAADKYAAED